MELNLKTGELVSRFEWFAVQKAGESANMPLRKAIDMMAFTRYIFFPSIFFLAFKNENYFSGNDIVLIPVP